MNTRAWLHEFQMLLWRFSGMGMAADIAGMSLIELEGLYRLLKRLAEAGNG